MKILKYMWTVNTVFPIFSKSNNSMTFWMEMLVKITHKYKNHWSVLVFHLQ